MNLNVRNANKCFSITQPIFIFFLHYLTPILLSTHPIPLTSYSLPYSNLQATCAEENRHLHTLNLQSSQSWCKPRVE